MQFEDAKLAVIITVYTEPLHLVEKAILHAKLLEMSHQVYIGDDGNRPAIRQLAQKYGVHYYTREERKHSKSGNISNILKSIEADFVAVFDVDHHPSKNFLSETLPYFADNNVGFVQTPQFYTNTHNVISRCASGSQNIFYELIMPGKNSFNAAFCVGTNVIFRKKALDQTFEHKFYLADHSEDIWVALKLHESGWKSIYIPKVLAKGLAPDTVSRYFKQQERWARGGYEIFFKGNPLFSGKLNLEQKLQYFFSSIHYFSGFIILVYLLIPILFLLFGLSPMRASDDLEWFIHFAPFFLSKFALILYLMGQFEVSLISGSFALFPVYIKALFRELLGKQYKWVATNTAKVKNTQENVWDHLHWHVFFVALSFVAIAIGLMTFENKIEFIFASFWTTLNTAILLHFIFHAIKSGNGGLEEILVEPQQLLPSKVNVKVGSLYD